MITDKRIPLAFSPLQFVHMCLPYSRRLKNNLDFAPKTFSYLSWIAILSVNFARLYRKASQIDYPRYLLDIIFRTKFSVTIVMKISYHLTFGSGTPKTFTVIVKLCPSSTSVSLRPLGKRGLPAKMHTNLSVLSICDKKIRMRSNTVHFYCSNRDLK